MSFLIKVPNCSTKHIKTQAKTLPGQTQVQALLPKSAQKHQLQPGENATKDYSSLML
jgi:hypothetical protein